MTKTIDWTKRTDRQPWSRDLGDGDRLSAEQAYCICETRLRDFGLELVSRRDGSYVVRQIRH